MTKASSNRRQAAHLITGCISKHKYATEEEAYQKGQDCYPCLYCNHWHRTSIKKPGQHVRKNGVLNLDAHKPKKKKAISPPLVNEHQQKITSLEKKNENLRLELEKRTEANQRYKSENQQLRQQYDRTIEACLVNLFHRLPQDNSESEGKVNSFTRERRALRSAPRSVPPAKRSGWIERRFVEWTDCVVLSVRLGITLDELDALLEFETN